MQPNGKRSEATNVYVVAENRLLRETLVRLFRKRGDICIVGNTCCSDSAIEDIAAAKSELLLLDCFNTNHVSDDWVTDLQESVSGIKIVLFGMDDDPRFFLSVVRRGIAGYVLKNASAAELLDAVRSVAEGEAYCPQKFCKVLFQEVAHRIDPMATAVSAKGTKLEFTQRQRQLMSLVARGLSNKEIAASLNLSEFTVKNHVYRVMRLTDAQNRHEAASLIQGAGEAD